VRRTGMKVEGRLRRLEAALSPRREDNGAKERFKAKLAAISEGHRAHRERGGVPNLDGQSMASLLGLVDSYPYGAVPPEVAQAARSKAQELSHGPQSAATKMVYLCLASKGYERGD
jgi:hypothetical protein